MNYQQQDKLNELTSYIKNHTSDIRNHVDDQNILDQNIIWNASFF